MIDRELPLGTLGQWLEDLTAFVALLCLMAAVGFVLICFA